MNVVKKLEISAIILGIWCVWLTALTNEYINDDGWIFYPIFGTIIFLTICVGLYLLFQMDHIYWCKNCKEYYHASILPYHNIARSSDYDDIYICDHCYEELDKSKKEEIDNI
jgi:hypothetical protein